VEKALVMVPPIQWYYQVVSIDPSAVGLGLGESAKSECTGYWKHLGEIRSMRHPSPRSGKTALVRLCVGVKKVLFSAQFGGFRQGLLYRIRPMIIGV
jgi:hypothetical protein